ncbi:MAG: hypothetical protein IJJ74_04405 [Eubacterium sp.]|nr:hypothetical protein [Eubacterium sp.]
MNSFWNTALDKHFPGLKKKYIETYGYSYELPSSNDRELMVLFKSV